MTAEKFFEDFIVSDHNFLHELYKKYQSQFNAIAQKFNDTGHYSIEFDQMSIPNEVLDFLDGNGFSIKFDNRKIIISRPFRNARDELIPSSGWLGYSYGGFADPWHTFTKAPFDCSGFTANIDAVKNTLDRLCQELENNKLNIPKIKL